MYKRIVFSLLPIWLAICFPARAEFIEIQRAIESEDVIVLMNSKGTGEVSVAACETCERQRFSIDSGTRAYREGKEVPLQAARSLQGKVPNRFVTVVYDAKDGTVEKLLW